MNKTIKQLALSTVVVALSSLSVSTFAADKLKDSSAPAGGSLTQITAQIYGQMKAAYTEANARLQQVDSYLDSFIYSATSPVIPQVSSGVEPNATTNPALAQPVTMPAVSSIVQAANSTANTNSVMAQIPSVASYNSVGKVLDATQQLYLPWYKIYVDPTPTGSLLADPKSGRANVAAQYLDNLTLYLPASDSFMAESPMMAPQEKQEAQINNNYFNFMNYFSPNYGAYNTTPLLPNVNSNAGMARGYAEFLSLSNQPVANDVTWALSQYEKNGQISPEHLTQLANVMKGDDYNNTYKKFLLQERQYNAARSMVNGMLSQIWVERSPVKGAATPILNAAADPATAQNQYFTPGDKTQSASPLQMERYIRTHRVNDPAWYQKMSTASPATVAREQLYVSAQLLAAQQQAHEDREKLLLATLLNAQGYVNGTMKTNLTMSETQLKQSLCSALGKDAQGICSSSSQKAS